MKRAERAEQYRDPEHGDALHKFEAMLRHFRGLGEADDMLAYVRKQARLWLRAAPEDFRFTALQLISERIQLIRIHAGLAPLDDPLNELSTCHHTRKTLRGPCLQCGATFDNDGNQITDDDSENVYRICKRELGL